MRLRDLQNFGRGINRGYRVSLRQTSRRFGEDATAAADVEVAELGRRAWRAWRRFSTARYEGVSERVHEMEETRGTVGVPPARGERIEVGYFCWVDGGLGGIVRGAAGCMESTGRDCCDRSGLLYP